MEPGRSSNFGKRANAIAQPTGPIEDDPNLTDKKFPGNPTRSYRTRSPLRVIGEIVDFEGHAPERVQAMKDGLARLAAEGVEASTTDCHDRIQPRATR
ncbi:MAG: NAD(+)--rifampin ADP-ribosyltransferase [Myxococcota bacterium]|nr:NAD(+)--rifampin ADP-ribosyltransferase [Myxococcota bacterium]